MPIAIDPTETVRYTLERERGDGAPERGASVFLLSPPTFHLKEAIWNKANSRETEDGYEGGIPMGTAFVMTCRKHLKGWENLLDGKGEPVKFEGDGCATDADLERLSFEDISELANAIWGLGKLTEDERGK